MRVSWMACARPALHGHRDAAAALKELVAGMPVNILRTPLADSSSAAPTPRSIATLGRGTRPRPQHLRHTNPRDAPPQVELAPIHVTGSRLPRTSVQTTQPVTIIDRDDILRSGLRQPVRPAAALAGHERAPAIEHLAQWRFAVPAGGCGHHHRAWTAWVRVRPCSWSMAGACHAIPWCRWNRVGSPILGEFRSASSNASSWYVAAPRPSMAPTRCPAWSTSSCATRLTPGSHAADRP